MTAPEFRAPEPRRMEEVMTKKLSNYTVRTYRNTEFSQWWAALNAELTERDLPEALYREAKDAYEMGQSPETEAAEHEARRSD